MMRFCCVERRLGEGEKGASSGQIAAASRRARGAHGAFSNAARGFLRRRRRRRASAEEGRGTRAAATPDAPRRERRVVELDARGRTMSTSPGRRQEYTPSSRTRRVMSCVYCDP